MAHLHIPDEGRRLDDPREISAFLAPFGIMYEKWEVERGVSSDASADEILSAYAPEVKALQERGGYVTADVINVTPDTPGLDEMINRFNKEHTHSDDEVRFCVKGRGLFHIHPPSGPIFAIEMEPGDLINVPAGTQHWFDLCGDRSIRAIRLFRDPAGWAPAYVDEGVHHRYEPLCFGPTHFPYNGPQIDPLVKV
jgi:1,2-dihydroxy-3-keto-5-methylthiopentene dioxygenase